MPYLPVLFLFLLTGCFDKPDDYTGIRRYPITEDIVNPPDSFLVLMPLRNNHSVKTFIRTDTSAVWHIEKTNASSSLVWISRQINEPQLHYINAIDTLGLEGGITYELYGNNNHHPEDRTLQLRFEKLSLDYASFPEKI
ncbi:MAG: hypothetical protein U5L09_09430 [Bacteroidales bacterium]|nr:hypothetical protein [Bacteroidales bacterium]